MGGGVGVMISEMLGMIDVSSTLAVILKWRVRWVVFVRDLEYTDLLGWGAV